MNDPGLDEPAQQAAQDVEKNSGEDAKGQAEEEEQVFLEPRLVVLSGWVVDVDADCGLVAGGSRLLLVR